MGKVYSPPKELSKVPDIMEFASGMRTDMEAYDKAQEEWKEQLSKWCKENSSDKYAGEIINEPVADGYAEYMILKLKPVALIHLPLGDSYYFRWAHRWTAKDIREKIQQDKAWKELVNKMNAEKEAQTKE